MIFVVIVNKFLCEGVRDYESEQESYLERRN